MKETVLVIATALISGLLATIVTILWQRKTNTYGRKMRVFEILMSYRYLIHSEESVKALNSVDVVFYHDKNVRAAYSEFLNETAKKPEFNPNINDKHLKLLEEMAKVLKLKNIHWDDIKQAYYPNGLSEKIQEEAALRKAQLQNAINLIENNSAQQNIPSSSQFNQQLLLQLLPELFKNPESLKILADMSKKANN